jgi:hypothetical protein
MGKIKILSVGLKVPMPYLLFLGLNELFQITKYKILTYYNLIITVVIK